MVNAAAINSLLTFTCICGLGLSIYAYTVELQLENDPNYVPMCDISEHMSCSKAFSSKFGKGFGFFSSDSPFNKPNSLLGIFYYSLLATLTQVNSKFIVFFSYLIIILSNFSSVYFAYILYFKLYDLCVVCVGTYVVNFVTLTLIHFKLAALMNSANAANNRNRSGKKTKSK